MNLKKTAAVLNGFIHDFTAGYWVAAMIAIAVLHNKHATYPMIFPVLNGLERIFFWQSVVALMVILTTGAGRTFTYVDNWYGEDSEETRRRMLICKHAILVLFFGAGYLWVWGKVFH